MITINSIRTAELSIVSDDEHDSDVLTMNGVAIAIESWHREFPGLLTCPATGDYDDCWLARVNVTSAIWLKWTTESKTLLVSWLNDNEAEITKLLKMDPSIAERAEILVRLQNSLRAA